LLGTPGPAVNFLNKIKGVMGSGFDSLIRHHSSSKVLNSQDLL